MNIKTKEEFVAFGRKAGLRGHILERYAKFMNRAFGQRGFWTVESYALEWVNRFKKGDPGSKMDNETLRIYYGVIREEK